MYQDSKRVRKHRVSVSLDDYEAALIQALVDYTGTERASLMREMLVAQAKSLLVPSDESIAPASAGSQAQISSF